MFLAGRTGAHFAGAYARTRIGPGRARPIDGVSPCAETRWIPETLFDELGFRMTYAVEKVLYEQQTEHQHLVLFEHKHFRQGADARWRDPGYDPGRIHLPRDDAPTCRSWRHGAAREVC